MKNNKDVINLYVMHRNETAAFAAQELKKYLEQILSPHHAVSVNDTSGGPTDTSGIRLGLFDDFGLSTAELDEPAIDDAIHIDVAGAGGIIAGSNARSILIAVYRFLAEIGCAWVRPGPDGEFIPRGKTADFHVKAAEKASYRYRGICIEGAVSFENVRENIEWAPKVGFNSYFLEFKTPFTFFDRWYSHRHNPLIEPAPVTVEQVDAFTESLGRAISKRGLLYHAVGHGWTGEPLGLPCLGWDPVDTKVGMETSRYFAQLDGKRELFRGVPLNTNLCYSNPQARELIVQYAADYAEQHRSVDILHFWLADAFNNHCECEACESVLPSDFYVMLLNELDAELTARGLDTKIVFLLYLDLLWPPETERLNNKERFILLFAPISRTYSRTYDADTSGITLQPFVRNQLKFPSDIRENVAFLKAWKPFFDGDSFAYEYHYMWDHYYDPGYYRMAETISADIKNLRKLGLNGMISDQTQRSFFPTGLGMYVMGRTLWNDRLSFEDLAKEYFTAAFGKDGERCMAYMARLSDLFDPPYLRGERPRISPKAAARLAKVPDAVEEMLPVIERNLDGSHGRCRAKSWEYLRLHGKIAVLLARAFQLRAEGEPEAAGEAWRAVKELAQRQEEAVQADFDVFLFIQTLNKEFRNEKRTHFGGEVT
jgi:hypothetical protein